VLLRQAFAQAPARGKSGRSSCSEDEGPSLEEEPVLYERAAIYVDKILKNPASLPVERPSKFRVVVE